MRLIDADNLSSRKFPAEAVSYERIEGWYGHGWNDAIDTIIEDEPTVSEHAYPFTHITIHHPKYGDCDAWLDKERQLLFVETVTVDFAKNTLKWNWTEDEEDEEDE